MADEPDWLRNNSSSAPSPVAANNVSSGYSGAAGEASLPYKKTVKAVFLFVNLGMMIFMAATGAIGIASSSGVNDTGVVFVGIYMLLFAAVQFIFEISQLCPGSSLDTLMKKNFGFLCGTIGKGLFILFMGILAFGLDPSGSKAKSLAIACGILVSAWGVLLILIYIKFPDYFDKVEKYQP